MNKNSLKIAVASPSFSKNIHLRESLKKLFHPYEVVFCEEKTELEGEELKDFLKNSTCAIIGKEKISSTLLQGLPKLKFISKYGVGTDNLDFIACKDFGVTVYTQKGTNSQSVAELTLGLILSALRNLSLSDRRLRQGVWQKYPGKELQGSTVGIIGCGHVGSRLARLLKAFDCTLLLNDIKGIRPLCEELEARTASFHEVLNSCDIISLHVPLTEKTHHMMDEKAFLRMKTNCLLINTSRGKVVSQKDLVTALKQKRIFGAALDVFEQEPLSMESELFSFDNLVFTTHIGGNSKEAIKAMGNCAIEGVKVFLRDHRNLS